MNSAVNTYQRQAILNASPEELISILYDMAITASYRKDADRLHGVLQLLIDALNYDYELSEKFYGLYEYCQHIAKEGKFDEVRELLDGVRDAWKNSVVNKNEPQSRLQMNG